MKQLTLIDLEALRAAGGTITINGEQIPASAAPAAPARPEPSIPPVVDHAAQIAQAREEMRRAHAESLQRQIDLLSAQVQLQAQRKAMPWRMKASYLPDGSIDELVATPA